MNKLLCVVLLLIVTFSTTAQDEIKANILSYSDSTELLIRNGRNVIVDDVLGGKHKQALSTLNYLKENVDKRYVILYPIEELILSLSTRNFSLFLYNAGNFNNLLEGKSRVVFNQNMAVELQDYLINEMPFIIEDLENSSIMASDKEVIRFYIRYYMNEDKEALNKSVRNHQKAYPDSEYSDFLKELKNQTNTGRMNFALGYGNEFLNGSAGKTFTDRIHVMNMEIDGFINKLYLSMFIGGNVSSVKSEFDLPVKEKGFIHSREEKVSSLKYGLKIGRSLYSNSHINIYPYLTIGGYEMNSQSKEFENNDSDNPKNNLTGSFMAGLGAAGDLILKRWAPASAYTPGGSFFIRPQAGYDRFLSRKPHASGSDFYLMISLGVSIGSY